jgi:hypothetical protein
MQRILNLKVKYREFVSSVRTFTKNCLELIDHTAGRPSPLSDFPIAVRALVPLKMQLIPVQTNAERSQQE